MLRSTQKTGPIRPATSLKGVPIVLVVVAVPIAPMVVIVAVAVTGVVIEAVRIVGRRVVVIVAVRRAGTDGRCTEGSRADACGITIVRAIMATVTAIICASVHSPVDACDTERREGPSYSSLSTVD